MPEALKFFATTPKGMEGLLTQELSALGALRVAETRAGVAFEGGMAVAYRACLWSRLASRILLPLTEFPAASPQELYDGVRSIAWTQHLAASGTLAVDCHISQSRIVHSHFAAQKVKDAIVDQLREQHGERPSVDLVRPDVRINLYLHRDQAHLALDLSGESLHRRGYREEGAAAPLKENLAAAILLRAGWPALAQQGAPLCDPMCGSGTLPIEAALMAADIAPGLLRHYYGFLGWRQHDAVLWNTLLEEAHARRVAGLSRLPLIVGYDINERTVRAARANARRAELDGKLGIEQRAVKDARPPGDRPGLVVVNPPYGKRLGGGEELVGLYEELGATLKAHFNGWQAAVFTGELELGFRIGLRARRSYTLFNGAIECKLLLMPVSPENALAPRGPKPFQPVPDAPRSAGGEMLANRLKKNLAHLGRWARRSGVTCYRVYDADLPEYALAVDLYQGEQRWVSVQEYEAPKTIDAAVAESRLREALAVIASVLELPSGQVFLKVRRRQKGSAQYDRLDQQGRYHEVQEGPCRFLVNFTDYLDTGLFLDHRLTRNLLRELAQGRRFLNLFAYTGTATVHAGLGGARSTTTVDMSATYLDWARRNLALNGLTGPQHELVQANCVTWLAEESARAKPGRYGLIFLDPPTFSNSKRMDDVFDVQRDHVQLITQAVRLLEPDGVLIFSTNCRSFRLDAPALEGLQVADISRATLPEDFARNPRIHYCWKISR